jgi:hypothetical protein
MVPMPSLYTCRVVVQLICLPALSVLAIGQSGISIQDRQWHQAASLLVRVHSGKHGNMKAWPNPAQCHEQSQERQQRS